MSSENTHFEADLAIIGGGLGGCAAALSACKNGLQVILTEETDWLGGQLTTQATPPDEHGWIEELGCTATYRAMRGAVRDFYRQHRPLTTAAKQDPYLNPGNGWVSPLCAEPKVFLAVLQNLLQPYVANGQLKVLYQYQIVGATTANKTVEEITLQSVDKQHLVTLRTKYVIDATELGDVLPLTETAFVTGAEGYEQTAEPSAKKTPEPDNVQAFSMCFAMSYHPSADYTIQQPATYTFWRSFIPELRPAWSGPLLRLTGINPRTLQPVHYKFDPLNEPNKAFAGLWTYRRILHTENFIEGSYDSDITLVNYPQIDFLDGNLIEATYEERQVLIEAAKQQSLSFLYYLQTELGFKGLRIRPDITDTSDGLAKSPYIRESRRIQAKFTIKEQDISAALNPQFTLAPPMPDSVGIGYYRIDLHPTTGGDNYLDVDSLPFQIPLGALIPKETTNLLAGCKNIGTTHITNGCYRLHPIEWNIGEVAGHLVAFCLATQQTPAKVWENPHHFQQILVENGVPLAWPADLDISKSDPHRHAM